MLFGRVCCFMWRAALFYKAGGEAADIACANKMCGAAHTYVMKKKKKARKGNEAVRENIVSANEYTGYVQHIPVSNEDIELYKKMYGGGSFNPDDIGS